MTRPTIVISSINPELLEEAILSLKYSGFKEVSRNTTGQMHSAIMICQDKDKSNNALLNHLELKGTYPEIKEMVDEIAQNLEHQESRHHLSNAPVNEKPCFDKAHFPILEAIIKGRWQSDDLCSFKDK